MATDPPLQATFGYKPESDHEHDQEIEHEAVTQARQRVEMQRELHGDNHPEFATALNHLALLLIMYDRADEAEPLLHRALAIRKAALGEDHADYATCLSSLGGLLWARGELDSAEPLLRQAHDIRCRTLGVDHPRSLASHSCLEQFVRMKGEQNARDEPVGTAIAGHTDTIHETAHASEVGEFLPADPDSEPEHVGLFRPSSIDVRTDEEAALDAPEPETEAEAVDEVHIQPVGEGARTHAVSMSVTASITDLSHDLVVLSDIFTELGERLTEAAQQLQTPGLPLSDALIAELAGCRSDFISLRDQTLALGRELHVDCPPEEDLASLEDLTRLHNEIAEIELWQSGGENLRRRSLSVLDRVLALRHTVDAEFRPLHSCQDTARALHGAITNSHFKAFPREVEPLAAGEHPLAQLLALVQDGDELSESAWTELHDSVAAAMGKPLAAAAARGKLVLPQEHVEADSEEQ